VDINVMPPDAFTYKYGGSAGTAISTSGQTNVNVIAHTFTNFANATRHTDADTDIDGSSVSKIIDSLYAVAHDNASNTDYTLPLQIVLSTSDTRPSQPTPSSSSSDNVSHTDGSSAARIVQGGSYYDLLDLTSTGKLVGSTTGVDIVSDSAYVTSQTLFLYVVWGVDGSNTTTGANAIASLKVKINIAWPLKLYGALRINNTTSTYDRCTFVPMVIDEEANVCMSDAISGELQIRRKVESGDPNSWTSIHRFENTTGNALMDVLSPFFNDYGIDTDEVGPTPLYEALIEPGLPARAYKSRRNQRLVATESLPVYAIPSSRVDFEYRLAVYNYALTDHTLRSIADMAITRSEVSVGLDDPQTNDTMWIPFYAVTSILQEVNHSYNDGADLVESDLASAVLSTGNVVAHGAVGRDELSLNQKFLAKNYTWLPFEAAYMGNRNNFPNWMALGSSSSTLGTFVGSDTLFIMGPSAQAWDMLHDTMADYTNGIHGALFNVDTGAVTEYFTESYLLD